MIPGGLSWENGTAAGSKMGSSQKKSADDATHLYKRCSSSASFWTNGSQAMVCLVLRQSRHGTTSQKPLAINSPCRKELRGRSLGRLHRCRLTRHLTTTYKGPTQTPGSLVLPYLYAGAVWETSSGLLLRFAFHDLVGDELFKNSRAGQYRGFFRLVSHQHNSSCLTIPSSHETDSRHETALCRSRCLLLSSMTRCACIARLMITFDALHSSRSHQWARGADCCKSPCPLQGVRRSASPFFTAPPSSPLS